MAEWLITYGSWCLAPFGLLGMIVVGRRKTWGWLLAMTTQILWAAYAVGTSQYGFLIGTVSYFCVYMSNFMQWRRKTPTPGPESGPARWSVVADTGHQGIIRGME